MIAARLRAAATVAELTGTPGKLAFTHHPEPDNQLPGNDVVTYTATRDAILKDWRSQL